MVGNISKRIRKKNAHDRITRLDGLCQYLIMVISRQELEIRNLKENLGLIPATPSPDQLDLPFICGPQEEVHGNASGSGDDVPTGAAPAQVGDSGAESERLCEDHGDSVPSPTDDCDSSVACDL